MSEALTLGEVLVACLDCSAEFFGDDEGPFSGSRARVIEADAELARRGLANGRGLPEKGDLATLLELASDAESGNAAAFEAAMRYVGARLFVLDEFPSPLAALAAKVLRGNLVRPQRRKAKEVGLRSRNIAVYVLVEICRMGSGTTAEEAYTVVAELMLKRRKQPNNPRTVKKIHLAARTLMAGPLTLHDLAVLQSFPLLPAEIAELAEQSIDAAIAERESTQDGAYSPPGIEGQDT